MAAKRTTKKRGSSRRPSQPLLSKSRYVSGLQCKLRLWNECHARDLATPADASTLARFATGHQVGEVATRRFPGGVLACDNHLEHELAVQRTADAMKDRSVPAIYEASFVHGGVRARVDILVRQPRNRWSLVEVKSSTQVKEPHLDDVAVQTWVLRGAGVSLSDVCVMTLNSDYVCDGKRYDYEKLFKIQSLKDHTESTLSEVELNVDSFLKVARARKPPKVSPGSHCSTPYDCPFYSHCTRNVVVPDHPITELPGARGWRLVELESQGISTIEEIPEDNDLTPLQERVRVAVARGQPHVSPDLADALAEPVYPIHHLDFETFAPAIPRYAGTRPYEAIPTQWSNHIEQTDGSIVHREFICREDVDPRPEFARSLLATLGKKGSICTYSPYETTIIRALAKALPKLRDRLLALVPRQWDLHPVVKQHYYHADFHGGFGLKRVLPVLVPGLSYAALQIQDGDCASRAYMEAITSDDEARRDQIFASLLEYCKLDTWAMVEMRRALATLAHGTGSSSNAKPRRKRIPRCRVERTDR